MKVTTEVSAGQIIQAVVVSLFGTAAIWLATNANNGAEAQKSVDRLQTSITGQIGDVKSDIAAVRRDIANLPDVQAQMIQMNRRLDQDDSRADAQSKRMEQMARDMQLELQERDKRMEAMMALIIRAQSDLDNVLRASQQAVPARH